MKKHKSKKNMDRVKRFIKERPFLSIGSFFGAISALFPNTTLGNLMLTLAVLVFLVWLLIYTPFKFFSNIIDIRGCPIKVWFHCIFGFNSRSF